MEVAELLAAAGVASMAIDGPGHGDRVSEPMRPEEFAKAWEDGGGTQAAVEDWQASLDFIEQEFGARPTGWWGLSMGF